MARVTQPEMIEKILASGGTVALLGGVDTGKTSFGLHLAAAANAQGLSVAYVDADVSRSTVGPPTCVGLKFCTGLDGVTLENLRRADELGFVGSTSSQGHLLPLVAATARLVSHARETGSDLVIIDTSALISGVSAEMLKYYKLELTRPNAVVGFQRGSELDPILGVVSRFFPVEVTALRVDSAVVERSAEDRLNARESSLASYFSAPLSRWRVKTTVFMPSIPPETDLARLDGLVVGLEDGNRRCAGIGLLEYEPEEDVLRMVSSVAEGAKGLRLGSVKVSLEGKLLGSVNLPELLGTSTDWES